VRSLGIDETSFLRANAEHATSYVTGFVDLDRHVLIDIIQEIGRSTSRAGCR